jgi:hypothetical protein
MKTLIKPAIICVLLLSSSVVTLSQGNQFDNSYVTNVLAHIKNISEFGKRQIGSTGSEKTAAYIKDKFEKIGLETKEETFESFIYSLKEINLIVAGEKYKVDFIGIDPYKGIFNYSGNIILFDGETNANMDQIAGRVVAAKKSENYFKMMMMNPAVVVFIDDESFAKMKNGDNLSFSLNLLGNIEKIKSSNIIGYLSAGIKNREEILITSHYDAYQDSPGANDNGTGISSMIELAKIFASQKNILNMGIRFIAFGGEEVGLLGSRMYLDLHISDLTNCKLLFNIDTIGERTISIETEGGVKDSPGMIKNKFPSYLMNKALEGLNGYWRIINPDVIPVLMISNNPAWLKEYAHQASEEEKINLNYGKTFFSDQMVFEQAGIPATGIAQNTGSKILHSSQDTIEKIDLAAIKNSGIICYSIILKTMGMKVDLL